MNDKVDFVIGRRGADIHDKVLWFNANIQPALSLSGKQIDFGNIPLNVIEVY